MKKPSASQQVPLGIGLAHWPTTKAGRSRRDRTLITVERNIYMLIVGAAVIELQQLIYEIQQHFSLFTFSLIFYVTEVALSMPCLPEMLLAILPLVT